MNRQTAEAIRNRVIEINIFQALALITIEYAALILIKCLQGFESLQDRIVRVKIK